jgi:DNA-binding beta-propeller fold protein YncE
MKNIRTRDFLIGTAFAVAITGLGVAPSLFGHNGSAQAEAAADPMVPKFEVDPLWPKPYPNHWVIGNVIGLSVDAQDNVWIVHRPGTLENQESRLTRKESICCTAAPDVLAFNPAGNVIHSWGRDDAAKTVPSHDWPTSNHGVTVAPDGTVWIGANGAGQPPAFAPGSAAQFAPRAPGAAGEGGGEKGLYHDSFLLHFTVDGKYLGEIGHANGSKGSLDTENVRGVATIRFLPDGTLVAADGYGDHRVSEWDPKTGKNIRIWGAYGKPPSDDPIPHYDVDSPQFGNPVHCAQPSNDQILYVCDRTNNRVQLFKFDGTYIKQFTILPDTKGEGSAWEIAFSRDPQQKFMYLTDGANQIIHVFDRQSLKELYSFGGGGRMPGLFYAVHSIVTDSKGNIYTTETYRGQRVQKFIYKGMVPLSTLVKAKVVGGSLINP